MKYYSFCFVLLLLRTYLGAQVLYSSDSLGHSRGIEVQSRKEDKWVVEESGAIKILYKSGEEYKRWESSVLSPTEKEVSYFFKQKKLWITTYSGKKIIKECFYSPEGKLIEKRVYNFNKKSHPDSLSVEVEGASLDSVFSYRADGSSLRSLGTTYWYSSQFSKRALETLVYSYGKYTIKKEYGLSRKIQGVQTIFDGVLQENSLYFYNENKNLVKEQKLDQSGNVKTELYYNARGLVNKEYYFVDNHLFKIILKEYNKDGFVVSSKEAYGSFDKQKKYIYDDKSVLKAISYYENGDLVKKEFFEKGQTKEVYYSGNQKVWERFFEN